MQDVSLHTSHIFAKYCYKPVKKRWLCQPTTLFISILIFRRKKSIIIDWEQNKKKVQTKLFSFVSPPPHFLVVGPQVKELFFRLPLVKGLAATERVDIIEASIDGIEHSNLFYVCNYQNKIIHIRSIYARANKYIFSLMYNKNLYYLRK